MSRFIDEIEKGIVFQRRNRAEITAWVDAERSRLGLDGMTLPHVPPDVLTQIEKRVRATVCTGTGVENSEQPPRLQIPAAAGLGKTSKVIEELARRSPWRVRTIDYFVPTTELAIEVAAQFEDAGFPVRVFLGRGRKEMCAKHKLANRAATLGLNVYRTLCKRIDTNGKERVCPHYNNCPYIAQWKDRDASVRLFVHNYIALPRPRPDGHGLPEPDLVIIDEQFFPRLIRHESFGIDRLTGSASIAVQEHLEKGADLRQALQQRGITARFARQQAEKLIAEIETDVTPDMADREARRRLDEARSSEVHKLAQFWSRVAAEIDLDRPFHGIEVRKDERVHVDSATEFQHRIHVHSPLHPIIGRDIPLLIIDADADLEINRRFFGNDLREVEIRVARNAHVVQEYSSWLSKRKLLGPKPKLDPQETVALRKVKKIIRDEVDRGRRVLAVMPKQVRKFLCAHNNGEVQSARYNPPRSEVWNGATVTHFGAIRGSDEWKDCDTVIIVGREEPNPQTFEEQARAIWADDPEPLKFIAGSKYPLRSLGYRMRDGTHWGVMTPFHPDPRVQRLLEFVREREMVQAIDRLRLIHAPHPKRVIILCNIPLDITVDELPTFDQIAGTPGRLGSRARLEAAMQCTGIVPLGARDLHHAFADLFSSVSAAKTVLKEAKRATGNSAANNRGGNQMYNLFGFPPHFRTINYRRDGQHGRSSTAVYDTRRINNPAGVLSILLVEEITEFPDDRPPKSAQPPPLVNRRST